MPALVGLMTLALLAAMVPHQAAPAPAPPAQRPSARPLKIVALGDSLTAGYRLSRREAYPALLEDMLGNAGLPFTVVNHGLSGDTSAGGVRRLDAALGERPQILLIAFGANDGLRGVPVAEMRANLARLVETAQAGGVSVILCGMEALPIYGWQYTLDFHRVFPELAARYEIPLVPFLLNGVIGNPDLMSSDGVHPNAAGAKILAANIWPQLEPVARRVTAAVPTPASHTSKR